MKIYSKLQLKEIQNLIRNPYAKRLLPPCSPFPAVIYLNLDNLNLVFTELFIIEKTLKIVVYD